MTDRILSHETADFLSLAAAPTFAVMALLSAILGPTDMLCASASPLSGMVAMYLLMSAFHLAPWLRLMSRRASYLPPEGEGGTRSVTDGGC
jgi:hypothetical protein